MSDLPYLEIEHIVQKYLSKDNHQFFNKEIMQPGWFGFYEPDGKHGCNKIPYNTCSNYKFQKEAAPINFVILNDKVTVLGEKAFEGRSDLLMLDASSSDELVLEKDALRNCVNLYKILLPYEIKSLDKTALYGCYGLSEVEITRGEWDGKKLERGGRILNPFKYKVVVIGGYPYIYNPEEKKGIHTDTFNVQKLVVKDGKLPNPIVCASSHVSLRDYPLLMLCELGHNEETAKKNLGKEIELVESTIEALGKTKTFSPDMIIEAVTCLKKRNRCY